MDEDFLKIGDHICLFSDTAFGYLTSIGHIQNLRNMIFQVVPKLSYDAMKEYRREQKTMKQNQDNPNADAISDMTQVMLQKQKQEVLKKRVAMNKINNIKMMEDMAGRKVPYGTPIQLMHVDSGYFLQLAKKISQGDRRCQQLELVTNPSSQRVTYYVHPRYRYRQEGECVVYDDHILLYNQKYNSYLHISEEYLQDQVSRSFKPSEFRPPSPQRRINPDEVYKQFECNMSQTFYKWQVINFRQQKSESESAHLIFSGEVISLKHAESSGILCFDESSMKKIGQPAFLRQYKGEDDTEQISTNSLFEIEAHVSVYQPTASLQGANLAWKEQKSKISTQLVTFRHLNSGKLLTVKTVENKPNENQGNSSKRGVTKRSQSHLGQSSRGGSKKLVLTLGENYDANEINRRIEGITRMEDESRYSMNFNPLNNAQVLELNQGVGQDQVFEIENTIIENYPYIKNLSVVKIRNIMYNHFISAEILKDGENEEDKEEAGDAESGAETPGQAEGFEAELDKIINDSKELFPDEENSPLQDKKQGKEQNNDDVEAEEGEGEDGNLTDKFVRINSEENDSVLTNMTKMIPVGSMDDVFVLQKYNKVEVKNILFMHSSVPRIKEFIFVIRNDPLQLKSPYMKSFEDLLAKMVFFVTKTDSEDPFTCEGQPNIQNQKYMRELNVIDLLIDIIIYPFEGENAVFDIQQLNQKSPIVRICQLIYRLLKLCSKDHEHNKFYVAQWISHFFQQSMMTNENNNLAADSTVTELLTNNKQLLDKQINPQTIRNIIQNCSDNQKNERFLNLLTSLCQCNGEAITSNQDNICDYILEEEEFQHLLIEVEKEGNQHFAIFNEPEIKAVNNGQPMRIEIDKMYDKLQKVNNLNLYNYFESMVTLVSLMCLERNYNGINILVEKYSMDFVVSCFLNTNLKPTLRANLAKLVISLHIDKNPLEQISVPILTRIWLDIVKGDTSLPSARVNIDGKLLKLKEYVVIFLEETQGIQRQWENDKNQLLFQVLIIAEKMVNLGFYKTEQELLLLLEPMIALLDGSNDFTSLEEELAFNNEIQKQNDEMLANKDKNKKMTKNPKITTKRDKDLRYKISEGNVMIIKIKKKIIDILHQVCAIQNHSRLTTFLIEFHKADHEMIMDPNVCTKVMRYLNNVLSGNEISKEEQQIKASCDEKFISWMKIAYQNKGLDMRYKSQKKDIICILLDIILYEDSQMVNNAFTLLTNFFSQKQKIIKYVNQIQLMQDAQEVAILNKVSDDLRSMRQDAENAEFWMGKTEQQFLKRARFFIDKLDLITDLCVYRPNRVIDTDEKKKKKNEDEVEFEEDNDQYEFLNLSELVREWDNEDPKICTDEEVNDLKNQQLLRNLSAYQVIITIIKQQGLESAEDKNSFLKVLEKCYIFLIKFVRNNAENQFKLVEYIDLFIDDMEYGVHSWELIAEIFKNSNLLLTYNLTPMIKRVVKLIDSLPKETQKKTTMLSFLGYFIKHNGNCQREIQCVVCSEITSVVRKNCDHLFTGELGLKDLHLYILEMKNAYSEFMNDDRYVQEIQIPPELSYTIEYIRLLASCGDGKNAMTETRAQEKLPIDDIIENLKLADFCFPLKSALVFFIDSIYFDIEKDISDENIAKMTNIIVIIAGDLEKFIEIQNRNKSSKGAATGGKNVKRIVANEEKTGDEDLDGIKVDINKNFTMLTSFGSFPILYLIERYVFEALYSAITQFFSLGLPIKPDFRAFFKKLIGLIKKASNYAVKDNHKQMARGLQKTIKKIPQLKDLGGDTLYNKNLEDVTGTNKKKSGNSVSSVSQISQANKLNAYIKSCSSNDELIKEFETEFEGLVMYIIQIQSKTLAAFGGTNTLNVKEIINALIRISDTESNIERTLRIVCLKIIRKVVELENQNLTTPAFEWDTEDWDNFKNEIMEQQAMLINLGVVKLICNLISYEQQLAIKEEAILVSVAILLGGNAQAQQEFNLYIIQDQHNVFMQQLKKMMWDAFEVVKKTQYKRNAHKQKLLRLEKRIQDLEELKSLQTKKTIVTELAKCNAEVKMIEEDLLDTEYDRDENPANYTTDELTVARAIKNLQLCMKLHQLFCENHNLNLQNTIRQQFNEDRKIKQNSFDFPTYYSKILEQFSKLFNNNTSDLINQLVETLTESIQGPCKLNQKALVQSKILDSSREYIAGFERPSEIEHLGFEGEEDLEGLGEFKGKIVTLLTSLLEGEIDMDIMTRMAFSLDQTVMKDRMLIVFQQFVDEILQQENVDIKDLSLNKINIRLKKESLDGNIAEVFEIYILMHSLADSIAGADSMFQKSRFTNEQWKCFEFIKYHTGRIEIVSNNNLQRVYFPIRPVCHNLSPKSRLNFVDNVIRDTHQTKVDGLMEIVPDLIDEMSHIEYLKQMPIQITPDRLTSLKDFSTVVGIMINYLFLFYAKRKDHYRELDVLDWVTDATQILGIIQGASSGILIFFYAINKKRLITQKAWRDYIQEQTGNLQVLPNNDRLEVNNMSIEMTHLILMVNGPDAIEFNLSGKSNYGNWFTALEVQLFNWYFFIQDPTFRYFVLYFGISILGYLSQDIFYSLHLLDVVNRIKTLQNVIKSVTKNLEQLSLTIMLLMIIVYIFTSYTFFYIQNNMYDYGVNEYDSDIVGENNCITMFQCFVSMMDKGLRFGGGIGDVTEPIHFNDQTEIYLVKLFHDFAFHIVVKIIMLNVLFGIIIDTFAMLRDEKAVKDDDIANVCFICNIARLPFEKYCEGGMNRHIKRDHNMWDYLYYMVHLNTKQTSDHTGIESYVLHHFIEKNIMWVPRLRALALQNINIEDEGDETREETEQQILQMKYWNLNICQIEKTLVLLLEQIAKKETEEKEINAATQKKLEEEKLSQLIK